MGDGKVDAIADLHRNFNGIHMNTEAGVAYKPFYNQLRKRWGGDFMLGLIQVRALLGITRKTVAF